MNIIDRFRLDGRKALVTGGGQGLGRAFAHALAEAGADVAVFDINANNADKVAKEINSIGKKSFSMKADISLCSDVHKMVDKIISRWGRLDIAVNNVGVTKFSDALKINEKDWDWVVNTNLRGTFFCGQAEAKAMMPNGYGKIINIASICGHTVWPQFQAVYNITKAGIIHLTRSLAAEWAKYGIRLNSISPGVTVTPGLTKKVISIFINRAPIGKTAEAKDLQGTIVFLASEASDFIIGQDIVVDGGYTII